jgi:predicted lipid-binding transport protein (Tim44 family)/endogenous inhibitor of DNA gyrase (YacG/DUF329 family)
MVLGFILLLVAAPDVGARAGGGGHYSSGGGSSGGGFGGGGSGGDGGDGLALVFFLIRLAIEVPVVGIPLLILVVVSLVYASYVGKNQVGQRVQGYGIHHGREQGDRLAREQGLAELRQDDPDFSPDLFLARVQNAFLRLQHAWSEGNLNPARHFVSDAVHERFSLQLAEMRQRGVRNIMENVIVQDAAIALIEAGQRFQTIAVRIEASAVDYEVDGKGRLVFGSRQPQTFAEYWSFIRRPGATSRSGKGLMEGNCPNCGGALDINQAAQCPFCQAKVRSGQYDWVLAEITQESEWRPRQSRDVPGLAALEAADPGFSLQHLEDRASVMFWRHIAAWRKGDPAPLRKMARDTCCELLAKSFRPAADGRRLIPQQAAVGSVDTLGILCADPLDQAVIEVRWSCALQNLLPDGREHPQAATSFRTSRFVLSRNHGTVGETDDALASAHCPACGAPALASEANACEYCGTVLNQGDRDWVLDGIFPPHDPTVENLLERCRQTAPAARPAAPASGGTELVAWMVYVMLSDGQIDDGENRLLHTFAAARGVAQPRLDQIIAAMQAGELEVQLPADSRQARDWLAQMAEMALADGTIAREEQDAMLLLGQHLRLTRYDVNHIIAVARNRLYQQTKTRLRELRQQPQPPQPRSK